jgi:RND family efflux transporter MFP subunit
MIAILALAVMIAISLVVFRPKAKRQDRPAIGHLVETVAVEAGSVPMLIEAYGTVRPSTTVKLFSEVGGTVTEVHEDFKEGRFFTKGDRLIQIDPRLYEIEAEHQRVAISQAEAELDKLDQEIRNLENNLEIARTDLKLSEAEFRRVQLLAQRNVVSQSALDGAEQLMLAARQRLRNYENQYALTDPSKKQLEAKKRLAEVLLKRAALDLEKTVIAAPFNGWVIEKAIEAGQLINPGGHLGTIYKDGEMEVEISIAKSDMLWLQAAGEETDPPHAKILYGDDAVLGSWDGVLGRFLAKVDERTRTFPAVVEINDSGLKGPFSLKPGMFVTVRITGKQAENVFILPRHVIHEGDVVYLLENNRLSVRKVHILRYFKESVYIDSGLTQGDSVITSALSNAFDGMPVRTR